MAETGDTILKRTWHHSRFEDLSRLVALKQQKGLKISLAFPTLNEELTIGKEILVIRTELMDRFSLLDEIAVIDSSSKDKTRQVAERFGAKVIASKHILPKYGSCRGKGENLWKSLYALEGDIIVWVDADISNIAPKFVYGLVGPLLENDSVSYVKAFYERPMRSSSGGIAQSGGGRVTEILVRPLFSLFYPELARAAGACWSGSPFPPATAWSWATSSTFASLPALPPLPRLTLICGYTATRVPPPWAKCPTASSTPFSPGRKNTVTRNCSANWAQAISPWNGRTAITG